MNELAIYGVIAEGTDGACEIVNPIYQHRILQTFKPLFNGLENAYFSEENGDDFIDYLTSDGVIEMGPLLDNFQAFIARAGFRILQVPDTPHEVYWTASPLRIFGPFCPHRRCQHVS